MQFSIHDLVTGAIGKKCSRLPWNFSSMIYKDRHADAAPAGEEARVHKRKRVIRHKQAGGDRAAIVIITDVQNEASSHMDQLVPYFSETYDVVLYTLKKKPVRKKAAAAFALGSSAAADFFWAKYIQQSIKPAFVIIDTADHEILVSHLNAAGIATVFLMNRNLLEQSRYLKYIIKYATRTVYESADCAEKALCRYIRGYPTRLDVFPPTADDLKGYAGRLMEAGQAAALQIRQERRDAEYLLASPAFDYAYWSGNKKGKLNRRIARRYVRGWKSGRGQYHPCAGFNPGIYAENNDLGVERVDPFVHWLQSGKPKGPWTWEVLSRPAAISDAALRQKTALHIHAYYPDMVADMVARLCANKIRPDLFISVRDQAAKTQLEALLSQYPGKRDIRVVPNRGRDIGPLLTEFGPELAEGYSIIGHIHTKQSLQISRRSFIVLWNEFIMVNLLGDGKSITAADTIIQKLHDDPGIGLIYPDDKNANSWTQNYELAQGIAPRLGIENLPSCINFPVGTMFWASNAALKPFVELQFGWEDYPEEPVGLNGTMLHALERLFGIIHLHIGKTIACTCFGHTRR